MSNRIALYLKDKQKACIFETRYMKAILVSQEDLDKGLEKLRISVVLLDDYISSPLYIRKDELERVRDEKLLTIGALPEEVVL
jgi:hypothetical protein